MSFIPVLEYLGGLGFFGFIYWLMNGILNIMKAAGVSITGNVYLFLGMIWTAIIFIYLIFGGIWLVRKYTEVEYMGGIM